MAKKKAGKTAKNIKDISERILYSVGKLAGSISADLKSMSKPFSDGFSDGKKS
jgi:hypothetical protein|tara:strand:- start:36 stop:194 length:159 start_codon:yes stop_codon:yes gene_type:complete